MKKSLCVLIILAGISGATAQNETKLFIDAGAGQTNSNPLIRLRNSIGEDLMWIHSDNGTNTFVGNLAGIANSGVVNTFIGAAAGNANQGANGNTAVGNQAMWDNRSGSNNTIMGYSAFRNSLSGGHNTAIGTLALENTNGAEHNTAVGYSAGRTYNNGWNNVFVGANVDVTLPGLFNVIAVGQGTGVAASSTARFGNAATGSYGGWAAWTNVSDGRFKKNIQTNVPGLDFILRLEPVTYNLDVSGISQALCENQGKEWGPEMKKAIADKEKMVQTGFVAQEVERIANEIGFDFSGVDGPKNENDMYGLRYAEFVVPLVKAVQELNTALQNEVEILTAKNDLLINRLATVEESLGLYKELALEVNK